MSLGLNELTGNFGQFIKELVFLLVQSQASLCHYTGTRSIASLQWHYMSISKHQQHACLINSLFRTTPKKTLKLHITSPWWEESNSNWGFPSQSACNVESVSMSWHHVATFATGNFGQFIKEADIFVAARPDHHGCCNETRRITWTLNIRWWKKVLAA